MLRYHLTYAARHLTKNKLYTLLNLFGLSIGLACFSMIGLWVESELSYDRFHEKSDRIYRVAAKYIDETSINEVAVTGPPVAAALLKDIPEIEQVVRMDPGDNAMAFGARKFLEDGLIADQSLFEVFDFKVLHGDRGSLLTEPFSVVLSESLAKKYFGDADPVGQSMTVFRFDRDGKGAEYKVTGIVEDCPPNSHFQYNFILSIKTAEVVNPGMLEASAWLNGAFYTYIVLRPDASPSAVESKFPGLIEAYAGGLMRERNFKVEYTLQPLTDIHLRSNLAFEIGATGSMSYVMIFGTIGIMVLLLACINYVNLSTAYSIERFKEVGIHKVLGAHKRQLVIQYLTESWLLAVVSFVIAFGWIELARPVFESISGTTFPGLYTVTSIGILFAVASTVGLLAGFYPSAVLSAFKPVHALKGLQGGLSGTWLRKILVVVQFSITIILVIGIMVVQFQMTYIQDKDLGFDKDNLVVFGVHGDADVQIGYQAFVDEVTQSPNVAGVTRSNTTIGNGLGYSKALVEDAEGNKFDMWVYGVRVDHEYLDIYKMKLIAGRNFRYDNAADSTKALIVNQALIEAYGYKNPADAIGKSIVFDGLDGQIIGVLKDFNFASLQHKVEPIAISLLKGGFSRISIRVQGDPRKGFEDVTTMWKKHFPSAVIQYSFYEDSLARSYKAEARFAKLFFVFSMISLAIACLGLFALVSYTAERRSKEIGIRKVLGASVANILSMLSAEFIWLVALSSFVAMPAGYYLMNEWLTGFAYHISLNAFMFIASGGLVLAVAWGTVSLRTFRAASANPVDSLRSE
ncbi:MAG TPA: ABC transporter permease [Cyclobacteriaceae bacterium]|nr:ABC transporter permease [Cyclobacteriaceae bacterium]